MGATTTVPADISPSHVRYGVLGFACSLSLLTYLDRICIMRVQENIQSDLALSQVQMGWVFSAFSVGYMLFEVPGGWMGDVWGSRRVLTRIVLCWSLFTALTGWADQLLGLGLGVDWTTPTLLFGTLLLVRFLFGCGEAGAYPNLSRVVGSWFPFSERAFGLGAIWMCARLGGALAPTVIGQLSLRYGWRQAFGILGLMGAIWCVFFYRWFRDVPEEKPECNAAERALIRAGPHSWKAEQAAPSELAIPWRRLLASPNVWALCLASFGVSFGWYFYPTWQPRYLKDVHQIQFQDSEILTGLPFLCGAVGCLIGGRLSDILVRTTGSRRWGRSLLGIAGFTGAGLCVWATGWVSEAWQAVALLCLANLVNDLAIPPIWAVCADIGGRYAGTLSGAMNMAGGVGAILSPALTPVLLQYYEWPTIFAILASAWFIAALAWVRIDATETFPQDT
jgi:ACS family glucarate transporter-like MFS transporter